MIATKSEKQIAEAQKKLDSFIQKFRALRAKYPEIRIVGDRYGYARAYIMENEFNNRVAVLE